MSYVIIDDDRGCQGSPPWLAFREGKIGASDAPSIMGFNPWETRLACWERYIFGKKKEKTAAMQRGNDLEQQARNRFNFIFDTKHVPVVAQSAFNPNFISSLDGWDGETILEIKCPNRETHLKARRGEVPENYICQMQHQMMVMGCAKGWYCSFDGSEIATIPVERNDDFIRNLILTETAFLSSLIELRPPEANDKDWVTESDPERIVKAFRLKELILQSKKTEEEREAISKELQEGAKHPRMHIGDLKMQKIFGRGRIDYHKILEDYRVENIEKYRTKSTETWRVNL